MVRELKRTNPEETINVGELMRSLDYARWDHPEVMKAFDVIRKLQVWLGSRYAPECTPYASIAVAAYGLIIMINDVCVWDSDSNSFEDLTVDFCREQYREHAQHLLTAFED